MAKDEKRKVVIEITDKGLKKVTDGISKLSASLDKLEKPINPTKFTQGAGKALGKTTEGVKSYTTSISEADRAAKSFSNTSSRGAKDFAKQSQGLGGLVHVYATVAANIWAVGAAFDQLKQSADLKGVIKAQESLAAQTGRSLTSMSAALKEGTNNTITLATAMKLASQAAAAGFDTKFTKDLAKVALGASKAFGRDITDSVERLTKGIAKMEPEILDELGIFVKIEQATRKYADANNLAQSELSELQRRQAFSNEAMRQGLEVFERIGKEAANNPYSKVASQMVDLKDSVLSMVTGFIDATGVIGVFTESAGALKAGMFLLVRGLVKQAIPALSDWHNSLSTKIVEKHTANLAQFEKATIRSSLSTRALTGTMTSFNTSLSAVASGARLAGTSMQVAFSAGMVGGIEAQAVMAGVNSQLRTMSPLLVAASASMQLFGKAAGGIRALGGLVFKLAGWISMATIAFQLFAKPLEKLASALGILEPLVSVFDRIGAATGLYNPKGIEDLTKATKGYSEELRKPLEGFKELSTAATEAFIEPTRLTKLLANNLVNLGSGLTATIDAFEKVPERNLQYTLEKFQDVKKEILDGAKALKQTKLQKRLEDLLNVDPKDFAKIPAILKEAQAAIEAQAVVAQTAQGKTEGYAKAIEDLERETTKYLKSFEGNTQLDKVSSAFNSSSLVEFKTELEGLEELINTGEFSLEVTANAGRVEKLQATILSSQKALKAIEGTRSRGRGEAAGGADAGITSQQRYRVTRDLNAAIDRTRKEIDTIVTNAVVTLPSDIISSEALRNVQGDIAKIGEKTLRTIGLSVTEAKRLLELAKTPTEGLDSLSNNLDQLREFSSLTDKTREGLERLTGSMEKQRNIALANKDLQASTYESQLKYEAELRTLKASGKAGEVGDTEVRVAAKALELGRERVLLENKIATIRNKNAALQAKIDGLGSRDAAPKAIKDAIDLQNKSIATNERSIAVLTKQKVALQDNAEVRLELFTLEIEQAERMNTLKTSQGLALQQLQQEYDLRSSIRGVESDRFIMLAEMREQDTAAMQAKIQLKTFEEEADIKKLEQQAKINQALEVTAALEAKIALLRGRAPAEVQEALAAAQAQLSLERAALENLEKTSSVTKDLLKFKGELATIDAPFKDIGSALEGLDDGPFKKWIDGSNQFAKVTAKNNKVLSKLKEDENSTDADIQKQRLKGFGDQASAMVSMFEEGSSAAKAAHAIEQAIHIARLAMEVQAATAHIASVASAAAADQATIPGKIASGFGAIVSEGGIPGLAIGAGFIAMMASLMGGSGGSSAGGDGGQALVKKQLANHEANLGENGITNVMDLETNALVESINDLVEIDTRLFSSMYDLQGSIVELGKSFKSVGSSAKQAFGGLTDRGVAAQFDNLPEIGPDLAIGSPKRRAERTIEDVLLQPNLELQGSQINPANITKASDYIKNSFDNLTALVITKLTISKTSTGAIKSASIDEFTQNIAGELSDDLSSAFINTIDTTFDLIMALDPGAHFGKASKSFQQDLVDNMISSFESGTLFEGNVGNAGFVDQNVLASDFNTSISLDGLSSSEAADRISGYFNSLSDSMIEQLFRPIDDFRRAGEEIGDTLARLVEETAAAVNAFAYLGFEGSMFDPSVMNSAGVQANLAFQKGLFEGFEDAGVWASLAEEFTSVILTEAEALENKVSVLGTDVGAGLERSISQALDVTNISGAALLGNELQTLSMDLESGAITSKQALLGFRTVWDQYSKVLGAAGEGVDLSGNLITPDTLEQLGSLDSTLMGTVAALGQLLDAEEDLATAVADETGAALLDFLEVINNIRNTVANMLLGDLSPLAPGQKLELAKGTFDGMISALQTETDPEKQLELLSGLETAGLDYLNLSKDFYGGVGVYIDEFERVKSILEQTAESFADQYGVDIDQQTLDVLEATYDLEARAAQANEDGLLAILNAISPEDASAIEAIYQDQLGRASDEAGMAFYTDQLVNQGQSLASIDEAINASAEGVAYDASTGSSADAALSGTNGSIEQLYQEELGRAADAGGLVFYADQVDSGVSSLDSVRAQLNGSEEGIAYDALGLDMFAEGGITSGVSLAGEAGPEAVVPLPDGRSIPVDMGGNFNTAELQRQLAELSLKVEEQTAANLAAQAQLAQLLEESNDIATSSLSTNKKAARQEVLV